MTSESARNRPCLMRMYIIFLIPSSYTFFKYFTFSDLFHLPRFVQFFLCFPSLPVISAQPPAFSLSLSLSLGVSHRNITLLLSLSLIHFFSFAVVSSSLSRSLSHLCFFPSLLIPSSPFHLHSHSSAVARHLLTFVLSQGLS